MSWSCAGATRASPSFLQSVNKEADCLGHKISALWAVTQNYNATGHKDSNKITDTSSLSIHHLVLLWAWLRKRRRLRLRSLRSGSLGGSSGGSRCHWCLLVPLSWGWGWVLGCFQRCQRGRGEAWRALMLPCRLGLEEKRDWFAKFYRSCHSTDIKGLKTFHMHIIYLCRLGLRTIFGIICP